METGGRPSGTRPAPGTPRHPRPAPAREDRLPPSCAPSSRTTSSLRPVYTPPAARTGRPAAAQFPGAPGHSHHAELDVIPFLVDGWHAPAGRRTWEYRPLAQARQIRPAAPVGAKELGRPTGRSEDNQRRQPNSRSGRDQATDPRAKPIQNHGSRAGALSTSSLPNRRAQEIGWAMGLGAPIAQFGVFGRGRSSAPV